MPRSSLRLVSTIRSTILHPSDQGSFFLLGTRIRLLGYDKMYSCQTLVQIFNQQEKQRTSLLDAALSESRSVTAKLSQDLQAAVRKGDQLTSELRAERDAGERARARSQEEAAASASESEKLQRDLREELENRKGSDVAYAEEVGVRKRVEGELGAARKALEDVTNEARQLKIDVSRGPLGENRLRPKTPPWKSMLLQGMFLDKKSG